MKKILQMLILLLSIGIMLTSCGGGGGGGTPSSGSGGSAVNNWTWVSGASAANQTGSYGTQGVADSSNVPGARYHSVSWIDSGGHLWLFGGFGYDSMGTVGDLNDLWRFDGSNWTWGR